MKHHASRRGADALHIRTRPEVSSLENMGMRPPTKNAYARTQRAARTQWNKLREALADEDARRDEDIPVPDDALLHPGWQAVGNLGSAARRLRDSPIPLRSYYVALISVVLATLLTDATRGLLGNHTFLFFLGAVVVSAMAGGLRAGLLAVCVSMLPCHYFLTFPVRVPSGSFATWAALGVFGAMGAVLCVVSDSLYLARRQADAAREQAESIARRFRFLAQASAILDAPLDYASLLGPITRAIVPAYADWATIDLLDLPDAEHSLTRVAASHIDADAEKQLMSLRRRFPLALVENHPLTNALRTGQGQIIADVGEAMQALLWHDQEYAQALRDLMPRRVMCVPLVTRGRVTGVLTFAATAQTRRYTYTDLAMARDLGGRVASAVENVRLHHAAQREIAERTRMEQRVREYSANLEEQRWELEEANIQLTRLVTMDGLTGLNNHMAFQEELARAFGRTRRCDSPLSLLLLDVDKFKQYNDTYGHPAGDQVLKQVAATLRKEARATDFVARYGGEEFIVILLDTDRAGALQMGERLRQAIESLTGLSRQVTASFGAATLTPRTESASELIAQADKALYASKHAGRNRVTHADTLPNAAIENGLPDGSAGGIIETPANSVSGTIRHGASRGLNAASGINSQGGGEETPLIEAVVSIRAARTDGQAQGALT